MAITFKARFFQGFTTILSLSLLLGGCGLAGSDVEEADYQLVKADETIEIRHYKELVLVTTPMVDDRGGRGAFMRLFGYISGDNSGEQKIEMTAPVFMDPNRAESMSFVLPRTFSIDNAPLPEDANVKLERWQDYTMAAIRFSGRLSQDNIAEHKKLLENWLQEQAITVTGSAKIAGYDDPMTLPMLRRNEVLIPVTYSADET